MFPSARSSRATARRRHPRPTAKAADRHDARAIDSANAYISGMTGEQRPLPRRKVFRQLRFAIPGMADQIDWTNCPDVERTPGKHSGAWCVKGTRIMVEGILDNAEDCTPEEIAGPDIFPDLSVDVVRRILRFARTI
jgi:uncharacterized protein (DUF433 family)